MMPVDASSLLESDSELDSEVDDSDSGKKPKKKPGKSPRLLATHLRPLLTVIMPA